MSQMDGAKVPVQIALQCCHSLHHVLESGKIPSNDLGAILVIQDISRKMHEYAISILNFQQPFGLIGRDGFESYNGVAIYIPTAITTLNSLAQSYNVCSFQTSSRLLINVVLRNSLFAHPGQSCHM